MATCTRCGRQLPPFSFKKICQWCVQHDAIQRGEISEDAPQPVIRQPWARRGESSITLTQVLFGLNIAVYLAMALASGSLLDFPFEISVHYGANFGPYTLSGEWWRLVTYMFLHGSLLHIGFNMWCLWDLGRMCESLYGRWTFAAIYVITGVGGGLASVAWNPAIWSVGASGAIFGLAGALIASFYLGEFSLPRMAIRGTLKSLLFFAGFNLLFGSMFPGIDNSCHIGGLVSGLALGAVIARFAPRSDMPRRRASVVAVIAIAICAAGFGIRQWRGKTMRAVREYQEARGNTVAQLEMLVRKQPNLIPAHFALAQAYYTRQDFPKAEAEFKHVLELDPKNESARFNLGVTYLDEKRIDDAKAAFTELLTQNSTSADAHYGLGLVAAAQGNYPAAITEFQTATNHDIQLSGVYYELGNSYAQLKQYDNAIAAYLKEKQKSGDDPDLENALADAYDAKGMAQQAQEARNQAVQLKRQTSH